MTTAYVVSAYRDGKTHRTTVATPAAAIALFDSFVAAEPVRTVTVHRAKPDGSPDFDHCHAQHHTFDPNPDGSRPAPYHRVDPIVTRFEHRAQGASR